MAFRKRYSLSHEEEAHALTYVLEDLCTALNFSPSFISVRGSVECAVLEDDVRDIDKQEADLVSG